jgi:hypothetical protein
MVKIKKLTGVRIQEDDLGVLAEEARRLDIPLSQLIRMAVRELAAKIKTQNKEKK